jgi:hypothetical protein
MGLVIKTASTPEDKFKDPVCCIVTAGIDELEGCVVAVVEVCPTYTRDSIA